MQLNTLPFGSFQPSLNWTPICQPLIKLNPVLTKGHPHLSRPFKPKIIIAKLSCDIFARGFIKNRVSLIVNDGVVVSLLDTNKVRQQAKRNHETNDGCYQYRIKTIVLSIGIIHFT